jgi:hypothetical protein
MAADAKDPRRKWQVDRFPICGHVGGGYGRENIVISCKACNARRCHSTRGWCALRGRSPASLAEKASAS